MISVKREKQILRGRAVDVPVTPERDAPTGQYTHGLARICKRCGQPKGIHDAVKPYPIDDESRGEPCEGFKAR